MSLDLSTRSSAVEGSIGRPADPQRISGAVGILAHAGRNVCLLPGGYADSDGVVHQEAELTVLTGEHEYLFAQLDQRQCRARLITELLTETVIRVGSIFNVDAGLAGELLVADREYLLMKLREAMFGTKLEVVLRCPSPQCAKQMDLEVDLATIPFERRPIAERYFKRKYSVRVDKGTESTTSIEVEFRLPNGRDQDELAQRCSHDAGVVVRELLARCIRRLDGQAPVSAGDIDALPEVVRDAIEAEMQVLSPQTDIELAASCPECGHEFESTLDLTGLFLTELKRNLSTVEREVHFLAWHYHWPEREILNLPRARRRRYVAFLQKEVDRMNQVW